MPYDEIVDIDRLPESALIGIKDICLLARRSRTSIWRDVKVGRLPKPIRLGAYAARWRVADVRQFLTGNQN